MNFGRLEGGPIQLHLRGLIYSHQGFFHHVSGTSVMGWSILLQVTHSKAGEFFALHGDFSTNGTRSSAGFIDCARLCTLFVYLNDVKQGAGQMTFFFCWFHFCCFWTSSGGYGERILQLECFFLGVFSQATSSGTSGGFFSGFGMWISEIYVGNDGFSAQKLNPFPPKKFLITWRMRTPQDPMVNGKFGHHLFPQNGK